MVLCLMACCTRSASVLNCNSSLAAYLCRATVCFVMLRILPGTPARLSTRQVNLLSRYRAWDRYRPETHALLLGQKAAHELGVPTAGRVVPSCRRYPC